jgi:hypothetical protein
MLFDQMIMEGWRSGQSQQTVNLPSLSLRWFKSSSLHHLFYIFITLSILLSSPLFSFDTRPVDPVELRTYYFVEEKSQWYKTKQFQGLVFSGANLGLSLLDGSASSMTYMMVGVPVLVAILKPRYHSDLFSLNSTNIQQELPRLQKKYKQGRYKMSAFMAANLGVLGYLLAKNKFSETAKPTMLGVVSQIFSMTVTFTFFKSSEELYLDKLEQEFID